jgi:hypothetical protein
MVSSPRRGRPRKVPRSEADLTTTRASRRLIRGVRHCAFPNPPSDATLSLGDADLNHVGPILLCPLACALGFFSLLFRALR